MILESIAQVLLSPSMIELLVLIISPFAIAVLLKVRKKLGLEDEKLNREALQTAISNAALESARRLGGPAAINRLTDAAIQAGVDQVKRGAGDAVAKFSVPDAEIAKRVEAQAMVLIQSVPTLTDGAAAAATIRQASEDLHKVAPVGSPDFNALIERLRGGVR